jgi:hypothetical protein
MYGGLDIAVLYIMLFRSAHYKHLALASKAASWQMPYHITLRFNWNHLLDTYMVHVITDLCMCSMDSVGGAFAMFPCLRLGCKSQ